MSEIKPTTQDVFYGRKLYILLAAIASVPLFLAIESYVRAIGVHEDEQVATAATMCFIAGIFAGRYLAQIWTHQLKSAPNGVIVLLVTIIIACIGWLFFHADFPLQGRVAINLILFWLPFAVCSLALGMLIKIVRAYTQNRLREAEAAAAQNKSELHLLQSQLSPHFLFNTLNNMYGLSLTEHEKIPPLLLKLSDLLRYTVYEANEVFVPLKDELNYIDNYIAFEQIRLGDRLVLNMDIEPVTSADIKIAPMLLIVFIENAFKHSRNSAAQQIFITISLKIWGNLILFSVKNSQSKEKEERPQIDKHSGFGLASVRIRLDLLYPGEHQLTIDNAEELYTVMLQLKMK
ncbi:histidine kinase [Ferruginibacter paludis]|uniref:sensor histidine kinase n=1 Tax=Ferruginibacter paludis TaxID=1310417 RepID=UPI0025B51511|nr:histidine kinase [Ferruginibacter paludis]MDN3659162.1 histidine kinase [Ferruginibacter paludis]